MDDDWDADDFVPPPVVSASARNNWEDEEEIRPLKGVKSDEKKAAPAPQKKEKKTETKKEEAPAPEPQPVQEEPVDPLEEKLRKQKLVEESDYQNTRDIFTGIDSQRAEKGGALDLDTINPNSEADFEQLAAALAKKLTDRFGKHFQHVNFLKSLVKHLATPLARVEDCRELSSALNVVLNDKLTKSKGKPAKKKAPTATVTSGKKTNIKEEMEVYDDDDDFM